MDDRDDPVADDEILYRRVPAFATPLVYYPDSGTLLPTAFAPHKDRDRTGISVFRAKHRSMAEAAKSASGKPAYVAVLQAGDLRANGIDVKSQPHLPAGFDIAHAELPDLTAASRRDSTTLERQRLLVTLTLRVEGPFPEHQDLNASGPSST